MKIRINSMKFLSAGSKLIYYHHRLFKLFIIAIAIFFSEAPVCGQNAVLEIPVKLSGSIIINSKEDPRGAYPFFDQSSKSLSLVITEGSALNAYLINENYKILKEITIPAPKLNEFEKIIQVFKNKSKYMIVGSNKNKTRFSCISLDYDAGTYTMSKIDLELRKEEFLQCFSQNNSLFFITIFKNTTILNVYKFDEMMEYKKSMFNFPEYKKLYGDLTYIEQDDDKVAHSLIEPGIINNLNLTQELNKFYYTDSTVILTIDKYLLYTYMFTMNFETGKGDLKLWNKPGISDKEYIATSNSLLNDKILYQAVATPDTFMLRISDSHTGEFISSYGFGKKDDIGSFSNTPIIRDEMEGYLPRYMEAFTPKQLLRKMNNENCNLSLSVFSNPGQNIELIIGAYEPVYDFQLVGMNGANVTYRAITSVSPIRSYESYKAKMGKSAYFKIILDSKSYKRISGNLELSVFKKIKNFETGITHGKEAVTVFKMESNYIYGYYNKPHKKYYLHQF